MTYEDYVKESIRNYMSDLFYLEGKGEDYFFGKSIWNDDLTLFYNDLGDRTMRLQSSADTAAEYAVRDLLKEVGIYANTKIVDLSRSVLNISAKSRRWFDKDDELLFGIIL